VLIIHREENVDSKENLGNVLEGMNQVYREFKRKTIFLVHPRTQKRIKEFDLERVVQNIEGFEIKDPIGYLDFLRILSSARLVLTDSGGVQQESCILEVPCVTLREKTEWTETLQTGANTLCGTDPQRIVEGVERMLQMKREWENPFGDGRSAVKITDIVKKELLERRQQKRCMPN
jgi:UDP-N-acetylglucosamine 2-epimerase (non-hydrolysing)